MKFVCYSDWAQLPDAADDLFRQAEKDNVFYSRAWLECLTTTALEDAESLLLVCVIDHARLLALLPLIQTSGSKTWYSMRHGFTPHYSLLIDKQVTSVEDQRQIIQCLVRGISEQLVSGLLLEPVAGNDDVLNELKAGLEASGFNCEYIFRQYNWIYQAEDVDYASYMAERPAQLRNTIERKKRKLARECGYDIQLFIGEDALAVMPDYYTVYNASWKQNEIKNADFQDCFVEKFCRAGFTRLAILYVNQVPIAAQLWFVHEGKASIFRLAYDKDWRAYSPGSILTSFMMAYVLDTDRVSEIDFLTGNDRYKQDWMSQRNQRFLLSCVKSIIPAGRFQRIVDAIKHLLKKR